MISESGLSFRWVLTAYFRKRQNLYHWEVCLLTKKIEEQVCYRSEADVLHRLRESGALHRYQGLNGEWKQRFMDFCLGKKTLPLTYDPFFKKLFHPDVHPERLSRLLSSLLGKRVKVKRILPVEDLVLTQDALLIMDILVEFQDGSLANVEVQKVPYLFPAERMSCYSADLLLRQYSRMKGERGNLFKYNDVRKVYTIVFFEKSIGAFHEIKGQFLHVGRTMFDTGLKLELLQEYYLVALDVYRKIPYAKGGEELNGWIGLLATENVGEAERLLKEYPWLYEIYEEAVGYMREPEEVLDMFSEALRILDRNTVHYMIEEQQKQIEELTEQLDAKDRELAEQLDAKDRELVKKDQELALLKKKLETLEQQ